MKRCQLTKSKPGVYVFRLQWEGKDLVTFVGAESQAEAEKVAERRLEILEKHGGGDWFVGVTDEEIEQAMKVFERTFKERKK